MAEAILTLQGLKPVRLSGKADMDALREVLTRSERDGVGLGHSHVNNLVMLRAVLRDASEMDVPVLAGTSVKRVVNSRLRLFSTSD